MFNQRKHSSEDFFHNTSVVTKRSLYYTHTDEEQVKVTIIYRIFRVGFGNLLEESEISLFIIR